MVNQTSHDDVAAAIREGCKIPAPTEKQVEEVQNNSNPPPVSDEEAKAVSIDEGVFTVLLMRF